MSRAIDKEHVLILSELKRKGHYLSLTSMVKSISKAYKIPESSLRNYANLLKELGLIVTNARRSLVELTPKGMLVLKIMGDSKGGENNGEH